MRLGVIYTRSGDGMIVTTEPTLTEIRFARGLQHLLETLLDRNGKKRNAADWVTVDSVLFGKVKFREVNRRGKNGYSSEIIFEKNELQYEELRHVLTLAIFSLTGEQVALAVGFTLDRAEWRFMTGEKTAVVRENWKTAVGSVNRGLHFGDLSRVVTRDMDTFLGGES